MCVCAEVTEVYDTMSCLPIVSDRAATEGSKYFELGRQPHEFQLEILVTSCVSVSQASEWYSPILHSNVLAVVYVS